LKEKRSWHGSDLELNGSEREIGMPPSSMLGLQQDRKRIELMRYVMLMDLSVKYKVKSRVWFRTFMEPLFL
jgi:hypothetical protein